MGKDELTKNDMAWEKIFDKYNILPKIDTEGFYEIKSKDINEFRESRLMAKFDHKVNLPKIFRENKLSILPVSRSSYVIGRFEAYQKVKYDMSIKEIPFNFPENIQSIDYNNLYSESAALHCAYVTGIIDDLLNDEVKFTVSGRMSSKSFDFTIKTNDNRNSTFSIRVDNSQCEIDAGFEGKNSLAIIEAKNINIDDFLIRQLYYPYRLWKSKITKQVVPVFMTYSNDIFSFFVYEFTDLKGYNSLNLIEQKNYIIGSKNINKKDIEKILNSVHIIPEPDKIPFPQADKFDRVVDLLGQLVLNDLSKEYITENYQFTSRQTDYYTNSAIYLNLVSKYTTGEDIMYTLTDLGRNIMQMSYREKYLSLIELILKHKVFNEAMKKYFELGNKPDKRMICDIMKVCNLYKIQANSTFERRAQTILGWLDWILALIK